MTELAYPSNSLNSKMFLDAEDILGIILVVRHALTSSTDNGQKHTGPTAQPDHLPIQVTHNYFIHSIIR